MQGSKKVTLVSLRPGSDVWESKLVTLTTAIVVAEGDDPAGDEAYLEAFGDEVTETWPDAAGIAS